MMTVPDHSLQDLNHDGIFFRVQDIDFLFGNCRSTLNLRLSSLFHFQAS